MGFKEVARNRTSISELYNGREKIETEAIVERPLTIEDFDLVESDKGTYGVVTFVELPGNVYPCGMVLTDIIMDWVDQIGDGEIPVARQKYKENNDKVVIILSQAKTKDNQRTYTKVEVK